MRSKHNTGKGRADSTDELASDETFALTAALEEREAEIGRLERVLTEQQAHIETLRDALERAKFKNKILEQSYSTQLGEARERATTAEHSAAERAARLADLEKSHAKLAKELDEARATLESFGPAAAPVSIDEMLASFDVPRDRPLAYDTDGAADAPADPRAVEDMLAPDVMLAAKAKAK